MSEKNSIIGLGKAASILQSLVQNRSSMVSAGVLVLAAICSRFLPHLPNSTAVTAVALVAGSLFGKKWFVPFIPLSAMMITDLAFGLHETLAFVYAAVALNAFFGIWWLKRWDWRKLMGLSLLSSLSFFAISNFGVWLLSGFYAKSAAGLIQCFAMALPFLQWQIVGDLAYTALGFTALALVQTKSRETLV